MFHPKLEHFGLKSFGQQILKSATYFRNTKIFLLLISGDLIFIKMLRISKFSSTNCSFKEPGLLDA